MCNNNIKYSCYYFHIFRTHSNFNEWAKSSGIVEQDSEVLLNDRYITTFLVIK